MENALLNSLFTEFSKSNIVFGLCILIALLGIILSFKFLLIARNYQSYSNYEEEKNILIYHLQQFYLLVYLWCSQHIKIMKQNK